MAFDPKHATKEEKAAYAAGLAKAAQDLAEPPLTLEDIRSMSVDEIKRRKSEVDEVLRNHTPGSNKGNKGDEDDE